MSLMYSWGARLPPLELARPKWGRKPWGRCPTANVVQNRQRPLLGRRRLSQMDNVRGDADSESCSKWTGTAVGHRTHCLAARRGGWGEGGRLLRRLLRSPRRLLRSPPPSPHPPLRAAKRRGRGLENHARERCPFWVPKCDSSGGLAAGPVALRPSLTIRLEPPSPELCEGASALTEDDGARRCSKFLDMTIASYAIWWDSL